MANNPSILCTNIFLSDNNTECCRTVTEKWAEYIRIMEERKRISYFETRSEENETL